MESYALLVGATLSAGTVLALAALGLLINEKAGIVNLGAEGMMLCAAIAGFATVVHTGNTWLGFAAGMAAGALLAALFGVLVIWLNTNQYAAGLALSLFGVGFSAFAGISYVQAKLPELPQYAVPVLGDVPLLGPALFRQHPLVYLAMALAAALVWFLYRSRAGLVLRSVGESPESAHALGYPVRRIRLLAVVAGGALCGLAGAYISTVYIPLWVEGMVAGRGWIALALSLFGVGFSAFAGISYVQAKLPETPKFSWPVLGDLPVVGQALFRHHPLVYLTVVLAGLMIWFLYRTRAGLVLRSVGESPDSAHALGYPVRRIRLAAVMAGGALCGLAGAYISTVYTPLWVEGMVAGRGWIALALTTFATWRPARVLLGAYLFGGVTMLQFHLQATGVQVASQLLSMLPYVATILVLALISRNPAWIRANMPASLGKPFYPGS